MTSSRAPEPNSGEFADLDPFEVLLLHPGRTLLEKLVHIHGVAQELGIDDSRPERRSGRHFYDVFQLLGDNRVRELLADRDQIELVMNSVEEITRTHSAVATTPSYALSSASRQAQRFDLNTDVSLRLSAAYEATMPELYFGAGSLPTWMRSVAALRSFESCSEPNASATPCVSSANSVLRRSDQRRPALRHTSRNLGSEAIE